MLTGNIWLLRKDFLRQDMLFLQKDWFYMRACAETNPPRTPYISLRLNAEFGWFFSSSHPHLAFSFSVLCQGQRPTIPHHVPHPMTPPTALSFPDGFFFETLSQALVEFAENDVAVSLMIDFNGTTLMAQRTEILAVSQISISSDIPDFSPPTCQRRRWSIIDSAKIPPRGWLHFSYFSLIISYVNLKS